MRYGAKEVILIGDMAALIAYSIQNHATPNVALLSSPFDALIPLSPVFIFPYLLFLPFYVGMIAYSFLKNRHFLALSIAHILIYLTAAVFFSFQQTVVLRPVVPGSDISAQLLTWLYSVELPYNAFPSLHTAMSVVTVAYFTVLRSRYLMLVQILAVIVIASTVLLKQHYLADVIGGLTLGVLASYFSFRYFRA